VHGPGFESLTLWDRVNGGAVHVVGSNICLFGGHQWWCSAWSWV
jgi:hypothetical protein